MVSVRLLAQRELAAPQQLKPSAELRPILMLGRALVATQKFSLARQRQQQPSFMPAALLKTPLAESLNVLLQIVRLRLLIARAYPLYLQLLLVSKG